MILNFLRTTAAYCWCKLQGYTLENFDFQFIKPVMPKGRSSEPILKPISLKMRLDELAGRLLTRQYYALPEEKRRAFLKYSIWGGKAGLSWHKDIEDLYRHHNMFAETREPLVKSISTLSSKEVGNLIELGCGNGWFLDVLSRRLQFIKKFIGLDVNEKTIQQAKIRYKQNRRLRFLNTDLAQFVKRNSLKKTVIVSCFVLEYFSQKELNDLCKLLKSQSPIFIIFIERVRRDNLKKNSSTIIGDFSYSHDYPSIFKAHGLKQLFLKRLVLPEAPNYLNLVGLFRV